jgi:CheY-like chemotaxis protein
MESLLELQGIRVLAVDDEIDNLELLQFILEQAGALVTPAPSAASALQNLAQSQPDIIVADIAMPEVDGYTLMRQIRELPPEQGGQTPAIALTAYADSMNQQQALAAGFQMHLPKPVEPDALVQVITALVAKVRSS